MNEKPELLPDYIIERTILDDLEEETGFVRIYLSNGETIVGKTDIILFESVDDEDDDCFDEIEYIRFLPNGKEPAKYFTEDEIKSYEVIKTL